MLCVLVLGILSPGVPDATGDDGEAEQLYNEAYSYHTGDGRPQNIRQAINLYQEVLKLNPRHINARYNLAGLCALQKRYDLAIQHYTRVIRLQPHQADADAYNNIGTIYEKQGKQKLARRAYDKALKLNPDVAAAHYNLGRLLLAEGKADEALEHIQDALRLEGVALRREREVWGVEPDSGAYVGYVSMYAKIKGETGKISNTTIGLVVAGFVGVLIGYTVFLHKRGG